MSKDRYDLGRERRATNGKQSVRTHMLTIREFVKGRDEEVWIEIRNESFKDYEDFRPATMEDMTIREKDPGFDPGGMLIAEWNGKAVGSVQAYVDRQRKEKKGYVAHLGVVPTFRRRGIGRELAEKAIENLKGRGMETAQCWIRDDKPIAKHLFESLGFKLIRVFSTMRRSLNTLPSNIGENKEVMIRAMEEGDEEIELFFELGNEVMSEHFDFRPSTPEEWKHWTEHPDFNRKGMFFALLEGQPVGHAGTWIDSEFVELKGIKRGFIDPMGVLKPYRRRGIGTALILRVLDYLKSKGMFEAELGVDDLNQTEAIKLYKKVGFKVVRKELTYAKQIVD